MFDMKNQKLLKLNYYIIKPNNLKVISKMIFKVT